VGTSGVCVGGTIGGIVAVGVTFGAAVAVKIASAVCANCVALSLAASGELFPPQAARRARMKNRLKTIVNRLDMRILDADE
jgi:hypothetical protein